MHAQQRAVAILETVDWRFIAQQAPCCVLHGNPLRKALVLSRFANQTVEILHESCNLPNSHDHSGTVLEYQPGFLCLSPLPSWCLAGPKRSIREERGSVHPCDGNKQQTKRLGWIVVFCEIKTQVPKCCTAGCLLKWVTFVPCRLHSHWLE